MKSPNSQTAGRHNHVQGRFDTSPNPLLIASTLRSKSKTPKTKTKRTPSHPGGGFITQRQAGTYHKNHKKKRLIHTCTHQQQQTETMISTAGMNMCYETAVTAAKGAFETQQNRDGPTASYNMLVPRDSRMVSTLTLPERMKQKHTATYLAYV